jgi:hypothetical protein
MQQSLASALRFQLPFDPFHQFGACAGRIMRSLGQFQTFGIELGAARDEEFQGLFEAVEGGGVKCSLPSVTGGVNAGIEQEADAGETIGCIAAIVAKNGELQGVAIKGVCIVSFCAFLEQELDRSQTAAKGRDMDRLVAEVSARIDLGSLLEQEPTAFKVASFKAEILIKDPMNRLIAPLVGCVDLDPGSQQVGKNFLTALTKAARP